jgi:hypothetical protein
LFDSRERISTVKGQPFLKERSADIQRRPQPGVKRNVQMTASEQKLVDLPSLGKMNLRSVVKVVATNWRNLGCRGNALI